MSDERDKEAATPALPWPALLPWQIDTARKAMAAREAWPPALLVYGRRGIGKQALGLNFAQGLLCETPADDGLACGSCPSCRYAVAGQHPDLMRIELREYDDADEEFKPVNEIGIKRIRALIDWAQITSHRQRGKVAVITPAERMTDEAANALLKTLEEPPAATWLMLVSDQPDRLKPTILSRCRRFLAPRPTTQEAAAWLAAQGVANPGDVLAQVNEAPLQALEWADPAWRSERSVWLGALADPRRLSVLHLAARVEAGTKEARRLRLARVTDWLLGWTVDLARVGAGGAPRQNPDFSRDLERLAQRVMSIPLFRFYSSLLQQRGLLAHPLQPRLVAEAMLIDYRAVFR